MNIGIIGAGHIDGTTAHLFIDAGHRVAISNPNRDGQIGPLDDRRAIFVSSDDAEAKRVVTKLIEEIGFGPVGMGSLRDSQHQQRDTKVYNRDVTVAQARTL